uniref:Uncharacterized protein LOC102801108 n=1 Tax=Saccoglossus kowalevskii TaxID=10224 RepID=A0ABM0MVY2_SACKO|nr:PREDICTED: uncharacterized protein LOC102801108 [Saccoglossus kowalevskii]
MAKNARRTNLSSASGTRPLSSAMEGRQSVATTLKPTTIDSGIYTPSVYEGPNLSEYGLPDYSHPSEDGDMLHSRLFDDPPRLKTPPTLNWKAPTGDDVCMVVEAPTTSGYTAPVFYDPDQSQGKTNEASEVDEDEGRGSEIDKDSNMDVAEAKDEMSPRSITVESIDDLATVVVAMILKQAISIACKSDEKEVDSVIDNNVLKQCGGFKSHNLKIGMLDEVTVKEIERSREESIRFKLPGDEDERHTLKKKVSITSKSSSSIDQEEDSLFGSDVEDETDPYFSKQKTYNLCNRKGIDAFRKFLDGTSGEKNWNFWLDVDKARSIGEQDVLLQ